jgi:hypothetical protein
MVPHVNCSKEWIRKREEEPEHCPERPAGDPSAMSNAVHAIVQYRKPGVQRRRIKQNCYRWKEPVSQVSDR